MRLGLVDVIGHITPASTGCYLVTPDGQDIKLKAQGFPEESASYRRPPPMAIPNVSDRWRLARSVQV